MKKVTKKQQIEDLQTVVAAQWRQINKLKLHLGRLVDIDWTDEQADHDAVIAILDGKEPKLKVLNQSVFDGLDAKWRFAAVDSNGEVRLQMSRPVLNSTNSIWVCCGQPEKSAGMCYDTTDWQNSLIERKELTGSDLCRAMLERGDKCVPCDAYNGADDRKTNNCLSLVTKFKAGMFHCAAGYDWESATPINTVTGEPLTAAEVGL